MLDRFAAVEAQYDLDAWVDLDDQVQLDILFGPGVRRAVVIDTRAAALDALATTDEPLDRIARRFGIHPATLRTWRKRAASPPPCNAAYTEAQREAVFAAVGAGASLAAAARAAGVHRATAGVWVRARRQRCS